MSAPSYQRQGNDAELKALADDLKNGHFAEIRLPNLPLRRHFFLVWHAEKRLTTGAERLRQACHAFAGH